MGTYNYKMFKCFNRKFTFTLPGPPPDVKEAFSKFSSGSNYMSADQLWRFLVLHQGEVNCTLPDCDRIVDKALELRKQNYDYNEDHSMGGGGGLTLDEFFHFLFHNDLNNPLKSHVHHDMNAPLSHYFIYTGHNSYLTGNQLSSDCSDVPIIKALQRGVRVIELDLWPNSAKDDINVVHGRTLTSPVSLIKCLKSINKYAFCKSHYPVIITLEDHLTPDLQEKVAEMAIQVFGETLYYPETDSLDEFPSPESLKGRILISTNPPKEYLKSKRVKDREKELPEEVSLSPDFMAEMEADDKNGSDLDGADLNASECKSCQLGAPQYKRLITIHAGKPKGQIKDHLYVDGDVRRLSLSEDELVRTFDSHGTDIVRFTQKHILRVYPRGTRVNSSNYRPHIGWIYGAQMVAFNMQGRGKSLWYMHGMFRANGGCGYVKKPEFLLQKDSEGEVFDPKRKLPVQKIIKVKVYMGSGWSKDFSRTHFDAFSPPDFYTKVCIVGVPADRAKKRTKVILDNWFPVWNREFEFPLTVPELALLRIEVREHDKHEKDDFAGQTCLPIPELGTGFRSVSLYDKKGQKLRSVKLLLRFQFE
ncbi:hypothetical protein L6164_030074 [Bauhinia variegata]|uniref:Uncharacterized protein n=1 Tax=Bauhinia variegata TaxID=167791 RepID=A0ACB9LAS6_BAUVA|nr:hypothetical protein L6164_030074 [Bauhinia variegata]